MAQPHAYNHRDTWKPDWIVHEGKVWMMADWTSETAITPRLISFRLHVLGWSEHDALTIRPETKYRDLAGHQRDVVSRG